MRRNTRSANSLCCLSTLISAPPRLRVEPTPRLESTWKTVRKIEDGGVRSSGEYALLCANRRVESNQALEFAVALANAWSCRCSSTKA